MGCKPSSRVGISKQQHPTKKCSVDYSQSNMSSISREKSNRSESQVYEGENKCEDIRLILGELKDHSVQNTKLLEKISQLLEHQISNKKQANIQDLEDHSLVPEGSRRMSKEFLPPIKANKGQKKAVTDLVHQTRRRLQAFDEFGDKLSGLKKKSTQKYRQVRKRSDTMKELTPNPNQSLLKTVLREESNKNQSIRNLNSSLLHPPNFRNEVHKLSQKTAKLSKGPDSSGGIRTLNYPLMNRRPIIVGKYSKTPASKLDRLINYKSGKQADFGVIGHNISQNPSNSFSSKSDR